MKKIQIIVIIFLLLSCGGYQSMNSFYNAHKNDPDVVAIQVPRFLLSTLSNLDPTMKDMFGNITELRYMQLNPKNNYEMAKLTNEMSAIANNNFIEVYRKNADKDRSVLSIRERKDVVKEILFYNNALGGTNLLYLKGSFDPIKVKEYADGAKFDSLASIMKRTNGFMNLKSQ